MSGIVSVGCYKMFEVEFVLKHKKIAHKCND